MQPPGIPDFFTRDRVLAKGPCRLTGRVWSGDASIDGRLRQRHQRRDAAAVDEGHATEVDDDTTQTLSERIVAVEHRIYPAAVRLVADMRVRIDGDRCLTEGAQATDAVMMTPVY